MLPNSSDQEESDDASEEEVQQFFDILSNITPLIESIRSQGEDTSGLTDAYEEAKNAFRKGAFDTAIDLADSCLSSCEEYFERKEKSIPAGTRGASGSQKTPAGDGEGDGEGSSTRDGKDGSENKDTKAKEIVRSSSRSSKTTRSSTETSSGKETEQSPKKASTVSTGKPSGVPAQPVSDDLSEEDMSAMFSLEADALVVEEINLKKELKELSATIDRAKKEGFKTKEVQGFVNMAKAALRGEEYTKAREMTYQARKMFSEIQRELDLKAALESEEERKKREEEERKKAEERKRQEEEEKRKAKAQEEFLSRLEETGKKLNDLPQDTPNLETFHKMWKNAKKYQEEGNIEEAFTNLEVLEKKVDAIAGADERAKNEMVKLEKRMTNAEDAGFYSLESQELMFKARNAIEEKRYLDALESIEGCNRELDPVVPRMGDPPPGTTGAGTPVQSMPASTHPPQAPPMQQPVAGPPRTSPVNPGYGNTQMVQGSPPAPHQDRAQRMADIADRSRAVAASHVPVQQRPAQCPMCGVPLNLQTSQRPLNIVCPQCHRNVQIR